MSVKTKIQKAADILKNEGVSSLVASTYRQYCRPFIMRSSVMREVQALKWTTVPELVDKVFTLSDGYIAPMQIRSEIIGMLEHVQRLRPKVVVEIGTARGGVLLLLAQVAAPDALIISIDIEAKRGGYPGWKKPLYKKFVSGAQQLALIKGNSHDSGTVRKVKEVLNGREVDFLFIDADHSYAGVAKDFTLYSPLVKKGGQVGFHDIDARGYTSNSRLEVYKFWDEVKGRGTYYEFVAPKDEHTPDELRSAGIGIVVV